MLASFSRLHTTSWILGVNYPISEAYAPIIMARRYFAVAAAMGTVGLLFLTWLVMKRLMSPLAAFTRHVELLPEKSGDERLVTLDSGDEIGVLGTAFNSLIHTLDAQREELQVRTLSLEKEVAEREVAQEALAEKQQQLKALNNMLEERIIAQVNELRQKDRMMIQQSRQAAMGEMINNIAHQWRQPLNNLGLIVQGMQLNHEMGQLSKEEMKGYSDMAMATIQFMSRTIDDFRNFFRPDKKRQMFHINQVVSRTISIIEGTLNKHRITIEVDTTDDPVVNGYPNEFSQVILNILTNARDAMAERGIGDPRIKIGMRSENGKAVVTIVDNAGGIPDDVIGRIFDPFFTTKGPDKGTGIGLYMSKEIIEKNMNGRLTARNTGIGAEFRIEV
ncbi:MAG: HAMP domain-containing histidine kinase [Deltaproteobacteria bacterium]|nr:HAMP domain-containing histidine kinase [Deltaproteobacteria bacterium]